MKVQLHKRNYGRHSFMKECDIPGTFRSYGEAIKCNNWWEPGSFKVNEQKILDSLPKGFLPVDASKTLLMVAENKTMTGLNNLTIFRSWEKYFDTYSLALIKRK